MNGSCFSLILVYELGGVRGLQPHIRTQNHGKLPPRDLSIQTCGWNEVYFTGLQVYECIRRNEAAIEICMHDVTDFRRPYTVLESTTVESKTSLSSYFVHGIFFPGIEILTLHRLEFSSPLQAK